MENVYGDSSNAMESLYGDLALMQWKAFMVT